MRPGRAGMNGWRPANSVSILEAIAMIEEVQ